MLSAVIRAPMAVLNTMKTGDFPGLYVWFKLAKNANVMNVQLFCFCLPVEPHLINLIECHAKAFPNFFQAGS